MAEGIYPSGRVFAIIFLVSVVLTGWYIAAHGPSNKGIIKVEPASNANTNTNQVTSGVPANTNETEQQGGTVQGATSTNLCAVEPKATYGSCSLYLGVYFIGGQCTRVYGCELNGDLPPFFELGECTTLCPK